MNTIDWSTIPEEYQWFAVDANNDGFAFIDKPRCNSSWWGSMDDKPLKIGLEFAGNSWRTSLTQRPDKTYTRTQVSGFLYDVIGYNYTLHDLDVYIAGKMEEEATLKAAIELLTGAGYEVVKL